MEFDPENRRQTISTRTKVLLEESLVLIEDADLEEWTGELHGMAFGDPRAALTTRFLHLPREILTTVMRDHQKYFAVENREGKLEPYFVAILNVDSDERGLIRQGHERVLTGALQRRGVLLGRGPAAAPARPAGPSREGHLSSEIGQLRRQGPAHARHRLAPGRQIRSSGNSEAGQRGQVLRAVELSKCDLTTQMVQEFAELQGVVGGLYAKAQGEPEAVATAIYDHYLPQGAEDKCPRTAVGALVSLADKLDAVSWRDLRWGRTHRVERPLCHPPAGERSY